MDIIYSIEEKKLNRITAPEWSVATEDYLKYDSWLQKCAPSYLFSGKYLYLDLRKQMMQKSVINMNAFTVLESLDPKMEISKDYFYQLVKEFEKNYLSERDYESRLLLHRNPSEVKHGIIRELNDYLLKIQSREEMRDIDEDNRSHGYVPTKVLEIWMADRRLRGVFDATKRYCIIRGKDLDIISIHIAEYRAMNILYKKISRSIYREQQKQQKKMAKNFETEIRETYDKKYLKIFFRHGLDFESVAGHMGNLHSVHRANVTIQQSGKVDLTVYPAKAYNIEETKEEVELTLNNYFRGNQIDPKFIKETVSSISKEAYYQVINYMIDLGVSLESLKRLGERFDEEGYRDYFIAYLNTISQKHSATGEAFHRNGKTDILFMNEKGEPVLIAECKLWKGEKYLLDAVDQLLGNYVNWRDEKIALVVFNRDNKKFSDVIDAAIQALQKHPLFKGFIGKRKETSYSFVFKNADDEKKEILLELVLFNFA